MEAGISTAANGKAGQVVKRGEMIWGTLCLTLILATAGILVLQGTGHNVAKEVSLFVGAQWGALLAVAARKEGAE